MAARPRARAVRPDGGAESLDELLEAGNGPNEAATRRLAPDVEAAGVMACTDKALAERRADELLEQYAEPELRITIAPDERLAELELQVSDAELMLIILTNVTGDGFVVLTARQRAAAVHLLEELEL